MCISDRVSEVELVDELKECVALGGSCSGNFEEVALLAWQDAAFRIVPCRESRTALERALSSRKAGVYPVLGRGDVKVSACFGFQVC